METTSVKNEDMLEYVRGARLHSPLQNSRKKTQDSKGSRLLSWRLLPLSRYIYCTLACSNQVILRGNHLFKNGSINGHVVPFQAPLGIKATFLRTLPPHSFTIPLSITPKM